MHFGDAFREALRLVARRWPLVLIRVAASIVNCIGFFVFVGVPIAIAIMAVGLELATANPQALLRGIKDTILSGHFGMSVLVLTGFFLYLVFAAFVWIYVLSGSMGMLARGISNREEPFRIRDFAAEAKKHLLSLMAFYLFVGLGFIVATLLIGIAMGGAVYITTALKDMHAFLAVLFGVVFIGFTLLLGIFLLFATLSVGTFGAGIVVIKGGRPLAALKGAIGFLRAHPGGFWGYCLLLAGFAVISFLLLLFGYPFKLIPVVGTLIILPYQLVAYAIERFIGLVLIGSAFSYYLGNPDSLSAGGEPGKAGTGDISQEAPGRPPAPPEWAPPGQEGHQGPPQGPPSETM